VVGARSALFLPYSDLGLVIVDEEHDPGFKQDDRVHYQGRDLSVVRGSLGKFPVILASATPSIESHVNARNGRYRHIVLPGRFTGADLPEITPIDMRTHPPEKGQWLSPVLVDALKDTLADRQQSLLFLNRRGYAPLTLCPGAAAIASNVRSARRGWSSTGSAAGSIAIIAGSRCRCRRRAPNAARRARSSRAVRAWSVWPKRCANGSRMRGSRSCPRISFRVSMKCAASSALSRAARSTSSSGRRSSPKGTTFRCWRRSASSTAIWGLSMGADPRAGERTFQLLHQVTGRAGRALTKGRGFIQTHMPEHPVMESIILGDREAFLDREIDMRRRGMLPPFGRLAALVISARDKDLAEKFAREVARRAPRVDQIEVLGPAEAPISVVRGRHRWRLLVKAPRDRNIQAYLRAWGEALPKIGGDLRLTVDIDPYNFL
jgi:primosomal protein N' (replication factor Y)